jgi:AraC-like DNA-binding protein
MNAPNGVPAVANDGWGVMRFSTADYAPRERVDAWREACGRAFQRMAIEPLSSAQVKVKASVGRLPGLAVATGHHSPVFFQRRRGSIDHDDVIFVLGVTSGCQMNHLGRTLEMNCGDALVMAGAEPSFVRLPRPGYITGLRVPARCLSPLVSDLGAVYGRAIPAESRALQLLTRYIGILKETETFAAPELRRQAVTHIHDLLALALGATRDAAEVARGRGARAAQLRFIEEDIATRFDQPDLSVAAVAARHGVKPRWVQRLFESDGTTFSEYLLTQRLARTHARLTNPLGASQKISTIAMDAGFGDLSYFNRMFRRHYGATPSDVRAAASAIE